MSSEQSGRTAKGFALIVGAARAAGLTARAASDAAFVQKAERDQLVILAMNNPVLAAAIHHARKSLPQFLALARHPRPSMTGFSVKIALLAKNGVELFWIHPFAHVDERFIGQINNTLRSAMTLKLDDTVSFMRNEIVDWMYIDGGAMKGNFSARAILKSAKPKDRQAFMRRFGLDLDFWGAVKPACTPVCSGGNLCLLHPFVAGATAPESDNVIGTPFALGVSHGGSYVRDRRT